MPAQPTLSTAAKRALTTTNTNTAANSSSGAHSGEGEATLPLKWVCAYSVKYRYVSCAMVVIFVCSSCTPLNNFFSVCSCCSSLFFATN